LSDKLRAEVNRWRGQSLPLRWHRDRQ